MSDSNIEMINKSLRSCSLSGKKRANRSSAVTSPPTERRRREVTVELNSGVPLPYFWEQHLDIRSGQMYYRNWSTGETTGVDPRGFNSMNSFSSDEVASSNSSNSSEDNMDQYFTSDMSSENSYSSGSSIASSSSYSSQVIVQEPDQVLILAGCQRCYLYLMVPKNDLSCPQCSQLLLDLSHRAG